MTCATELRQMMADHELVRPDHMKCLDPDAPCHLREEFVRWRDHKEHLLTQLTMAESAERNVWRHVDTKQPIQPVPWAGGLSDLRRMQTMQSQKHEIELEKDKRLVMKEPEELAAPVEPKPALVPAPQPQDKAEEMRDYRARRSAGATLTPGRPCKAQPSREALQRRTQRARLRELQG